MNTTPAAPLVDELVAEGLEREEAEVVVEVLAASELAPIVTMDGEPA